MTKDKWVTMAEKARELGVSRPAILQAVREGRIESNGKTGRECRVRGALAEPVRNSMPRTADGINIEALAGAKLENLKRDAILKDQRIKANREAQWREDADAIAEEYLRAFAPVTARLTEMRLPAAKLAVLRKIISDCTAEFFAGLKKRWSDHESADI